MKGATPTGPKVVMPSRATPRSPTCHAALPGEHRLQPVHADGRHELGEQRAHDDEHEQRGDEGRRLAPAR